VFITVTANFESTDSLDKVANFYKSKFPNAVVTTSDEGHLQPSSPMTRRIWLPSNIEAEGDQTKIQDLQCDPQISGCDPLRTERNWFR